MISLPVSTKIDINFGKLEEIIEWCEANCIGKWSYTILEDAGERPGKYRFFFDHEDDHFNFVLWKK